MKFLFWTIPIFLFIAQLVFTLNSQTQIRYEELAESVRNPFWLEQGRVYDGVSSHVGWYTILLVVYKLFGFSLATAQIVKLVIFTIAMFCLAMVLRKYLKGHAWLPLLLIGFSPTILYDTAGQAQYGIDFLFIPIAVFLILNINLVKGWLHLVLQPLSWIFVMLTWLSQPANLFYFPMLLVIYAGQLKRIEILRGMVLAIVGFLTPLAVVFLLIKNKATLIYDPNINSGLFRGSASSSFGVDNFIKNLSSFLTDLFAGGKSYHFEVGLGDFSLIFPIITIMAVIFSTYLLIKKGPKSVKKTVWLILFSMLAVLVIAGLSADPTGEPGIRRFTAVLSGFYVLFILGWDFINRYQLISHRSRLVLQGCFLLLLLHHLIAYPINLIHLKDPSPEAYPIWFNTAETPRESLQNLVDRVQKEDLKLACLDENSIPFYCRLSEVYAAVAGSCRWNHLNCHQILGYDFNTGQYIPLTIDLWDSYYFEH